MRGFGRHTYHSEFRALLLKCAGTAMSSKLIVSQRPFFAQMAVDAVLSLDQTDLNEKLIGIKEVPGGAMPVSYTHLTLPTICSV